METAIILDSQIPGPIITILGGVHGNEKCGVEAINNLLPNLKISKGKVIFIYANPRAIKQNVRFTEANLNRMFWNQVSNSDQKTYEYQRAQYIKQFLDQSELCLDIHASHTPASEPFAICEKNGISLAKKLPVQKILTNIDAFEPGGTDGYMWKQGKIGICIESGYLGDTQSTKIAEQAILIILNSLEMVTNGLKALNNQPDIFKVYDLYHNQGNFKLTKNWSDFQHIPAQTIIGYDDEKPIKNQQESHILFARNINIPQQEAFLLTLKQKFDKYRF